MQTVMAAAQSRKLLGCQKELRRWERHDATGSCLLEALFERREEFRMRFTQHFGFIQYQDKRIQVVQQHCIQRTYDRHEKSGAGKELAIVGKNKFVVEILLERFL